ncbi:hypothetical protein [Actinosynnema mirum]|uniref:Uncharacterized protein n=1 Tax=Actinosynnema mirum (strain ATCC 29888 / DSM 43827 / JCM 3225 / NBRC 14064 / NCIMB 13271 / NRRL B-12336 / IMRU 3971 / 101) TaxID=446462 RepID=C6WC46_ACTMD|nr:hypothetical protein [Actinosynnema mirum]ACU39434.1 hypothetical protein Amir_5618 [Actinosynnema mirum DSM 43827]
MNIQISPLLLPENGDAFLVDVEKGLLYRADAIVPIKQVGETWGRDSSRPIHRSTTPAIPVVPAAVP